MENIRLKKITVSPLQSPLIIQNGNVHFYDTTGSSNLTNGAIVTKGGISINATNEATSSTSGGCLTIGGGAGIKDDLYIGKDLILDNLSGVLQIAGLTENRLFLDTIYNKQFYVSVDGVNKRLILTDDNLRLAATTPSSSSTWGALTVDGGIGISTTTNAVGYTHGGGLTVAGGGAFNKDLFVGGSIVVANNLSAGSIVITSGSMGNVVINNITATGDAKVLSTSNTIGNIFTTGGNVGIKTTAPGESLHVNGNIRLGSNGTTEGTNYISFRGSTHLFAPYTTTYIGESTNRELVLFQGTDRIRYMSKAHKFDTISENVSGGFDGVVTYGSTSMIIDTNGNVGIGNTSPSQSLTINGNATMGTLFSANVINTNSTISSLIASSIATLYITGGSGYFSSLNSSSGSYFNVTITNSTIQNANISVANIVNTNSTNATVSSIFVTNVQVSSAGSFNCSAVINTMGNITTNVNGVGIGQVSPSATLDINGTLNCSNNVTFTGNVSSSNSSTGTFVLTRGGISINTTANAVSLTQGGGLTIRGGASVQRDMFIGGKMVIEDTTSSISITNGSVVLAGGMAISNTTNSVGLGNGGALSVSGGGCFGKDIYIGGKMICNSVGSFSHLKVLSTDVSTNSTTGGIVSYGGVSINETNNAVSVSQGGALTVAGGVSLGGDLYVGGDSYLYGGAKLFSQNAVDIYDNTYKRFSVSRDASSSDLQIKRYNQAGAAIDTLLSISHTAGSISLLNTGGSSFIVAGGMSIGCTNNATSVSSGGGITVVGGGSIGKDFFVGGDVTIASTRSSADVSSGSLIVKGGVGISGNINVLGDTLIKGNLTVQGATVSVTSTHTIIKDNMTILNAGPAGTSDAGIVMERYQVDNDSGLGDVVNDLRYLTLTLPDQSGLGAGEVNLGVSASSVDGFYNGWWIKVSSGFTTNGVRKIVAYNGTTKLATLSSSWTLQNPAIGDIVYLYNKSYVGVIFNETTDRFIFGSLSTNPGTSANFSDNMPVEAHSMTLTSTVGSTNGSVGSLVVSGGISISNTTDASSPTHGGSLTSLGGIGVRKSMHVGENLFVNGPVLKLPVGNTALKPLSPQNGYIYLDTDLNDVQVYLNSAWTSVLTTGTLADLDGNTKIKTEDTFGSNDNNITFIINNNERMRLSSAGNLGIGTTSPTSSLHVNGEIYVQSSQNAIGLGSGGSLTISGGASISKDLYVGGAITSSSDIRLKENVRSFTNKGKSALQSIDDIRTVRFNYKYDPKKVDHIGFIAQDFIEEYPEILKKPEEGFYSMDYSKVTVILLQCIKELKAEIKSLKSKLIQSMTE
uniref:Peptidase S74 domain-containing protein n=1 Tax=viral metagenome TaxID=1070528 RepID=A0A6C0DZD0_9ZZZZ